MEYFTTQQVSKAFVVRLDPGEYVLESIRELIIKENLKDAVVLSAIGTLDECRLHMVVTTKYPPENRFEHWKDRPLELAHIGGVIADGEPHLHLVVSDHEKAYLGHLEEGCRVLYLCELVIMELKSLNLKRVRDEKNILRLTGK